MNFSSKLTFPMSTGLRPFLLTVAPSQVCDRLFYHSTIIKNWWSNDEFFIEINFFFDVDSGLESTLTDSTVPDRSATVSSNHKLGPKVGLNRGFVHMSSILNTLHSTNQNEHDVCQIQSEIDSESHWLSIITVRHKNITNSLFIKFHLHNIFQFWTQHWVSNGQTAAFLCSSSAQVLHQIVVAAM